MTVFSIAEQLVKENKCFAAWAIIERFTPPGEEALPYYVCQLSRLLLEIQKKTAESIYLLVEERAKTLIANFVGSHEKANLDYIVSLIEEVYVSGDACDDEETAGVFLYFLIFRRSEIPALSVLKLLYILKIDYPGDLLPDRLEIAKIEINELRKFFGAASRARLHDLSRSVADVVLSLTPNVLWEYLIVGKAYEAEGEYELAYDQYIKFSIKAEETENLLALKESARRVISMLKVTKLSAEHLEDFVSSLPESISGSKEVRDLEQDVLKLIELKNRSENFFSAKPLISGIGYEFMGRDATLELKECLESRVAIHPNYSDFYSLAKSQLALGLVEEAKKSLWNAYCSNALMFG